jgi:hypothetical protein
VVVCVVMQACVSSWPSGSFSDASVCALPSLLRRFVSSSLLPLALFRRARLLTLSPHCHQIFRMQRVRKEYRKTRSAALTFQRGTVVLAALLPLLLPHSLL